MGTYQGSWLGLWTLYLISAGWVARPPLPFRVYDVGVTADVAEDVVHAILRNQYHKTFLL